MFGAMTASRALGIALASMSLALSGCSTGIRQSEFTATPDYVSPSESAHPTAASNPAVFIEGTRLKAGPEPNTALGPNGDILRFVAADPAWSPKCRAITQAEKRQLDLLGDASAGTVSAAVDAPGGLVIIAYQHRDGDLIAFVTDGERFSGVGSSGWTGSHTHAGVAVADGPRAQQAALDCLG